MSKMNVYLDFPVAIIVTLLAAVPTIINKKFSRWQGIALLALYAAYLLIVTVFADEYLALFGIIA